MKRSSQKNDVLSFIIANSDVQNFKTLLFRFSAFIDNKKISFEEIDYNVLCDFKQYLHRHLKPSTVKVTLSYLRRLFDKATKEGITQNYPFSDFKIIHDQTQRLYFSPYQVQKLKNTPAPFDPVICHAFFFICYTGLTTTELKSLTILQAHNLKLMGKAFELLNMIVRDRINKDELLFANFPSPTKVSRSFRLWGALAGLTQRPTFPAARNTFIADQIEKGKSMKEICKHIGIKRTYQFKGRLPTLTA